jgi:3-oxoacyl-[acyl-carrier protein] reductase
MDLKLDGKHALVCGGSEGIGRAAAHELALLGASVTLLARRADALRAVADSLPRNSGQTHGWIAADSNDPDDLARRISAAATGHRFEILVNNSGGPPGGPAHGASADAFVTAFRQHLLAARACVEATLPGMQDARWGRIVNIISTSVKEPIANLGVSNTIRGAVASWAKTLSRELAPFGITVNNVLPGYTRTGRLDQILRDRAKTAGKSEDEIARGMLASVPAGRFAEAAEIAAAVAFLASPAAAYINGVSLAVDGGRMQSI